MPAWLSTHQDWHESLSRGEIVVVLKTLAGPIADARSASRQMCNELLDRFPDHRSSRSATAGLAAVALSKSDRVGIDVERIDRRLALDSELLDLALDSTERTSIASNDVDTFLRLWTCKESALKAAGVGLALPAATVHVGRETGHWTNVSFDSRASPAWVRSLAWPPGFVAAVATLGAPQRVRIVRQFTTA